MSEAENKSKIDILELRARTDDTHRQELGRRLYEAEKSADDLEKRIERLEGDRPGRKEVYIAILAGLAITVAVALAS